MRQKIIRYAVMIVALGVFMYSAYRLTLRVRRVWKYLMK